MSARDRAQRLAKLYALRKQIEEEICDIETSMAAEMEMVRQAAREARIKPRRCGSDSGYYRHLRELKEPACPGCLEAHRDAERRRKAAREQRGAA